MSNILGSSIDFSLFGESHGPGVGFVLSGLPAGLPVDVSYIEEALRRRRGIDAVSTGRREKDSYSFLSGVKEDTTKGGFRTTGTPLTAVIENADQKSEDYEALEDLPRPGHADFTADVRYHGYQDKRGGGAFSGRLTAPVVMAGAMVRRVLEDKGILIASHIAQLGPLKDDAFPEKESSRALLSRLAKSDFPLIREGSRSDFLDLLSRAKADKDSWGGRLETQVMGLSPGYGSLFFDRLDARLAYAVMTIPGVKGVTFGAGMDLASMTGSQANDPMVMTTDGPGFESNRAGGIQGGISTGMPILFQTVVKPTPSIGKPQRTVNLRTGREEDLVIRGRHDPAIVHRAFEVVNAMTALVLFDIILAQDGPSSLICH